MPNDFESLVVARLDRLEGQHRRLRWFAGLLLLLTLGQALVVAALLAPIPAFQKLRTVRAGEFVLLDPEGRTRAALRVGDNTGLALFDAEGLYRGGIIEDGRTAALHLMGREPRPGGVWLTTWDDGAELVIRDGADRKRVELVATKKDTALRVFDAGGRPVR